LIVAQLKTSLGFADYIVEIIFQGNFFHLRTLPPTSTKIKTDLTMGSFPG